MKVWITKYALTSGIFTADAEVCTDISDKMIHITNSRFHECYHKPDWHTTWEEALARAKVMQANRARSLRKQLDKVLHMLFDPAQVKEIPDGSEMPERGSGSN